MPVSPPKTAGKAAFSSCDFDESRGGEERKTDPNWEMTENDPRGIQIVFPAPKIKNQS